MTFQQYLLVLRARWRIVAGVFFAVILLALAWSLFATKEYVASASVFVDVKSDPLALIPIQTGLQPGYMATQVDIVGSDRVAQRVVKSLKLDQSPAFIESWKKDTQGKGNFAAWLGGLLQKKLEVKPSKESSIITIDFKWPEPKAAAALANAFAQAYIDTNIEIKVEPAKQYAAWFETRAGALRAELEAKQKALSDFQREKGIVATDERLDIENARLAELSTQLVGIQAQRADSQSRQRQTSGNKENLPEVLQSGLIAGLKTDLSRAEARREEVVARLGKNHPEYQRTDSEIASLRERIAQEIARVTSSMGTTNQVNVQRESEIRAALAAQKQRLLELKQQRDEASVLQNAVTTAQRNLDAVNQRLAQSSLESLTQQTNIVVLTPASEPTKHASPNLIKNMLLAVVLGGLLGVGLSLFLELLDQRVRGAEDLKQLLGVPVLGTVSAAYQSRKERTRMARAMAFARVGPANT